jgi:hypothetical protein
MIYFEPNQRQIIQEILIDRNNQKKQPAAGNTLFLNACEKVFGTTDGVLDRNLRRSLLIKIAAVALRCIEIMDKSSGEGEKLP